MNRALREIGASVKRLQVRQHRAMSAALAPLGISPVQWDALRHLQQNAEASLHDLAQLTYQTDQSFGTLAGRMIERGLIERVAGPGRAVHHRITEKGHDLRAAADELVESVLGVSFGSLTIEELEQFDALLTRLMPPPPTLPLRPRYRNHMAPP